jgi:hypothetical protein
MLIKALRDGFGLKHYLLPRKGTGLRGTLNGNRGGIRARFDDSKLLFIHGLLSKHRIGSCSSLPVLFTAVGRRLGYPIRLVLAVQHIFIRWEDDGESFNMEGSGPDFINSHPSEFYIDQPRKWTHEEKTCGALLRAISPLEELAAFLYMRYSYLRAHNRWVEARDAMRHASRLHPGHPHYAQDLDLAERYVVHERTSRAHRPKFLYTVPFSHLNSFAPSEILPCL